jgi:hypothetical protein
MLPPRLAVLQALVVFVARAMLFSESPQQEVYTLV